MREIITDWTTLAGGGFVTVTYWEQQPTIADQRAAWNTFLEGVSAVCNIDTGYSIRTEGRDLDDTTGQVNGAWTEGTTYSGVGTGGSSDSADATQALVRWNSDAWIDGRRVRGRTFIPGIAGTLIAGGNLGNAGRTAIADACAALVAAAAGFGIWHRPKNGTGGQLVPASSGSAWSELAVLRRRRR